MPSDAELEAVKKLWIRYDWLHTIDDGTQVPRHIYYTVGMMLGYPVPPVITDTNSQVTTAHYLYDLMKEIAETKVQLQAASRDAMAVEVGDLKLDYSSYINALRVSGSTAVAMLSQYVGVPLKVDMFTGRSYETGSTPFSIKVLY